MEGCACVYNFSISILNSTGIKREQGRRNYSRTWVSATSDTLFFFDSYIYLCAIFALTNLILGEIFIIS